jgi:Fe2+ or Zn2+ uptake regulation protein
MTEMQRVTPIVPDAGVHAMPVHALGACTTDMARCPDFVWELHGLGVRATVTRLRILELLHREQGRWMRAEDVYRTLLGQRGAEALPSIYRNLKDLERVGLVLRAWEEGRRNAYAVYQLRGDRSMSGGVVLVCDGCGARFTAVDPVLTEALRMLPDKVPGLSAQLATVRISCIDRHACFKLKQVDTAPCPASKGAS